MANMQPPHLPTLALTAAMLLAAILLYHLFVGRHR